MKTELRGTGQFVTVDNQKEYWEEEVMEEVPVKFSHLNHTVGSSLGYSRDFLEQSRDMSLKESFYILSTLQDKLDTPPKFENSLPGDVAKAYYSVELKRHFEKFVEGNRWIGPRYLASKVLGIDEATLNKNLTRWISESDTQLYLHKNDVLNAEYINLWDIKTDLKKLYKMKSLPKEHASKIADILGFGGMRKKLRFLEVDLLS